MSAGVANPPEIIALAGPNGAGKSTFYHAFLAQSGLRFLNADDLTRGLQMTPYEAAELAAELRRELVRQRQSFIFETVFSDPVRDKLSFLADAATAGFQVTLCFIGIAGPDTSEQRVSMRVSQGGHDVPTGKLLDRYPRVLANLKAAIPVLPKVLVFDNEEMAEPFRKIAEFERGRLRFLSPRAPGWFTDLL